MGAVRSIKPILASENEDFILFNRDVWIDKNTGDLSFDDEAPGESFTLYPVGFLIPAYLWDLSKVKGLR